MGILSYSLMLHVILQELEMTSNVINFVSYCAENVKPRCTPWSSPMWNRRIDHLHNLRLKHDLHPAGVQRRSYYPNLARPQGGLFHWSDTQRTMNKLIDLIRAEAPSAVVVSLKRIDIVEGIG
jgi:hypothetical protein